MKGFNYIKFDSQCPSGNTFEPFFNLQYTKVKFETIHGREVTND